MPEALSHRKDAFDDALEIFTDILNPAILRRIFAIIALACGHGSRCLRAKRQLAADRRADLHPLAKLRSVYFPMLDLIA